MMPSLLRPGSVLGFGLCLLPGPWSPAVAGPSESGQEPPGLTAGLLLPAIGGHALRVLAPTWLELREINTAVPKPGPGAASEQASDWNLVDPTGNFIAPKPDQFAVMAGGHRVPVVSVGFKRRPFSVSMARRDLRIDNALYLELAAPVVDGETVAVTNPGGAIWPSTEIFVLTVGPLRTSPAIHVNQEGYVPAFPKKAMVGYYLGSLGELPAAGLSSFSILDLGSGKTVFRGSLQPRPDVGYGGTAPPYQQVLQADFSPLVSPGRYRLVVPGLGASLPFRLDDGIAMAWLRTYALGLYHQRSGAANALPYTRFVRDADHRAAAEVPSPQSAYEDTWTTIASKNATANPTQTAPRLKDEASQLYPFVNKGRIDVSGGHFDAGDYSKYTIDSASLVHTLMFTVDSMPGAAALDNLGIPESGDGIPDLLQEAKREADSIAKLQDADGGFYFIVYPKSREYEDDVPLTDGNDGDPQVVWPKNTSATAASVAALAECASSPLFRRFYPADASLYLRKAGLGWRFLMNAIDKYGKAGAYQKITFYGDDFADNDEESWAACEMYLATGDPVYQQKLFDWFPNPADPATFTWNWVHMSESYGNAIRSYAFAARSGRLKPGQLDPAYLSACETEILAAGDDALLWSRQNAYATSFPTEMKRFQTAGWYFSLSAASDMAVAYQLDPDPAYLDALVGNLNYEGGTNPVNVTYLTGLGIVRQHAVVDQYAANSRRAFAPDGIPIGNIQSTFNYLPLYGRELDGLTFPSNDAVPPFPFYDRWADAWNVTTEFVTVNQARSILALSVLVARTRARTVPWRSGVAHIVVPTAPVPLGVPLTLTVETPGLSAADDRVLWEARDQQPAFGPSFTVTPSSSGPQWVEVEVEWPDGRRVFAAGSFTAGAAPPVP